MKRLVLISAGAFLCLNITWAADQPARFSGTWILDSKRSDPVPHSQPYLDTPMHTPDETGHPKKEEKPKKSSARSGQTPAMNYPPVFNVQELNSSLIIEQTDTELQLSFVTHVDKTERQIRVEKYKFKQSENVSTLQVPNLSQPVKLITKAILNPTKFVIRVTAVYPGGRREIEKTGSLSKDEQTLTLNTSDRSPTLQLVQKQIYHR